VLTYPPSWKLWVCVEPTQLWFLRINSRAYRPMCVPIPRALHDGFLDHDSWLGCGGDLIALDEVALGLALARQGQSSRRGIVGVIHPSVREAVLAAIGASDVLTPVQQRAILAALTMHTGANLRPNPLE
jgi:hypothetical protein